MKNTEAAESMPRRANLALGSMRSGGVLNDLARYATHQSRISSSVGYDFTNYFVPRGGFESSLRVARFVRHRPNGGGPTSWYDTGLGVRKNANFWFQLPGCARPGARRPVQSLSRSAQPGQSGSRVALFVA